MNISAKISPEWYISLKSDMLDICLWIDIKAFTVTKRDTWGFCKRVRHYENPTPSSIVRFLKMAERTEACAVVVKPNPSPMIRLLENPGIKISVHDQYSKHREVDL